MFRTLSTKSAIEMDSLNVFTEKTDWMTHTEFCMYQPDLIVKYRTTNHVIAATIVNC